MTTEALLEAALGYARRGWPVFPVHSITADGCTCGRSDCASPGKHPRVRHGVKDASTHEATIRSWWNRWPDANVAIATGKVVVLDIDADKGGETSLARLELELGELPLTLEAETGSGGRHLVYAHPGGKVKNRVELAAGLDVRSHGGYIVAPPSIYASGRRYRWLAERPVANLGEHPAVELLRAPAPPAPAPLPPRRQDGPPASRDVARVRGILRAKCEHIARLRDGRRQALLEAAHQIGGYLHLGLARSEAEGALLDAARACGADQKHNVARHIRYGLDTGATKPISLPPDDDPPPATPRPPPPRSSMPPRNSPPPPPPPPGPQADQERRPSILERVEQIVLECQLGDADSRAESVAQLFGLVEELADAWETHREVLLRELTKLRVIRGMAGVVRDVQRMIVDCVERRKRARPLEVDAGDIILGPDIDRTEVAGIRALVEHDEDLFQRGGRLIQTVRDAETEKLTTGPIDAHHLRTRLSRVAAWKAVRKEGVVRVPPPLDIARGILSRGEWRGVRPLVGIVHEPVLRRDGTILQTPGYDPRSCVLYEPSSWYPTVPHAPTLEEAQESCERLLGLVRDFPFVNGASRLGFIAAVLTPLARYAFDGPAPWFMWTANVRGTGKSLQAAVATVIATGEAPAAFSCPASDDEMRKLLTSVAIAGRRLVLFDNIAGDIGWASLDAVLTSNRHGDRILGQSAHVDLEMRSVFFGTSNNPTFRADTARRVLPIPLDSPRDDPENRASGEFAVPDLMGHVLALRHELVVDALTILRAYCAAGRPRQDLAPWGSYEAWSGLVRGAIVWMGYPDPHGNVGELAAVDLERVELERLVAELRYAFGDATWSVRELVGKVRTDRQGSYRDLEAALYALIDDETLNERKIGRRLTKLRNRVVSVDGQRVRIRARLNRHRHVYEYRLE